MIVLIAALCCAFSAVYSILQIYFQFICLRQLYTLHPFVFLTVFFLASPQLFIIYERREFTLIFFRFNSEILALVKTLELTIKMPDISLYWLFTLEITFKIAAPPLDNAKFYMKQSLYHMHTHIHTVKRSRILYAHVANPLRM